MTSWVYTEAEDGTVHRVGVLFCIAWMNIIEGIKITKLYGNLKNKGANGNGLE